MNTLYPGQPDYTGPDAGWAYWVHHNQPIEYCTSFAERLAYIREQKPAHEHAVRLAALTCLPAESIPAALTQAEAAYDQARAALTQARAAYDQARAALTQDRAAYDQARAALTQAETEAFPVLMARMAELVPAHLWNEGGLVFPEPS